MMWFASRLSPSLGLYMARKQNDKVVKILKKNLAEKTSE
jgi:hypothetical protein